MKSLLSLLIWLFALWISTSFAFTPSQGLQNFLEQKASSYEQAILDQGEPVRTKLLNAFEQIERLAPSNNYRSLEKERFGYIIWFLKERVKTAWPSIVTLADFPLLYRWFEIVQYPEQIVATVRNTGPFWQTNDDSFQNLAWFIFGDNESNTEIAMTSPVTRTQLDQNSYESAFIMPSWWTMNTLPVPNNERITIKTIPSSLKAVKRFSWWATKQAVDTQRETFQQELSAQWVTRYGLPTLWQYDWPRVAGSSRRNELSVQLNP